MWELPALLWGGCDGQSWVGAWWDRLVEAELLPSASGQRSREQDMGKTSRSSLNTDNRSW